jgi:hypothetical protein
MQKHQERTRIAIGNSSAGHYAIFDLTLGTMCKRHKERLQMGQLD